MLQLWELIPNAASKPITAGCAESVIARHNWTLALRGGIGSNGTMSTLLAIAYPEFHRADEVRVELIKLQKDYLVSLEDAVVVTKSAEGKIKLHQPVNLTAAGAATGGFWGLLIGLIFLMPFFGMAIGLASGALSGALSDLGISDKFMKELSANLPNNSSALFILIAKMTDDRVLPEIEKFGGTILQTSLSHEDEEKLKAAMAAADGK